jgi:hypothetical protein
MNIRDFLHAGLCLAALIAAAAPLTARADDMDLRQNALMSKINVAAHTKQLTPKDASALRKAMANYDRRKKQLRAAHSDAFSAEDDALLSTELGAINQQFEEKVNKQVVAR